MDMLGSLVCVGLGMTLGAHITPRSRSHIEQAEVVFAAVSDPLVELWLQEMHGDVRSLQPYYGEGKSRHDTYREMVEAMLAEVRAGRRVCGAFYGHPGVFALVPHQAIEQARREGFPAHMEPGISAEDCLYADLGIDPGRVGCQHFEASQFMFYQRRIDPSATLVLWQVGIAGDRSLRRFATGPEYRRLLVELLAQDYPPEHEVIVYEAATLPINAPRMERMPLSALVDASLHLHSTLVVPPAMPMQRNQAMLDRIAQLDDARTIPRTIHPEEGIDHVERHPVS
ncbi:MAG TPA: SAM-dependent methyltransferase [Lysobacter sp.]